MSKVTKGSKLDKELKPEFGLLESEEDYIESFEEPVFKPAVSPEPTLIDVMNELHQLKSDNEDLQHQLTNTIDAVKALGARVIESNEKVMAELELQNGDFHTIKDAIVYGLAKLGTSQPEKSTVAAPTDKIVYGDTGIEWRDGKYGQWTFTMNQDGSPNPKTVDLIKAIKEAGGKLSASGYIYSLSKPDSADGVQKFLNRRKQK